MHKPRSVLSPFVVAIVAGMAATMLAMVGAAPAASACSIAPARAEVSPSTDLRAGQAIKIAGWGFLSVTSTGVTVPPVNGTGLGNVLPPDPCGDIKIIPVPAIAITWRGTQTQVIAKATGPDFFVEARVPDFAQPGRATIDVAGVAVQVTVGPKIDPPPPPCPLAPGTTTTNPATAAQPSIGCPLPCPLSASVTGSNASAAVQYPCPDPCPVYATGSGTVAPAQDATRRPCPDPCASTNAAGGAAIWCPDPCPLVRSTQDALRYCPDPCSVFLQSDQAPSATELARYRCPDPCAATNTAQDTAIWCPDPCSVTTAAQAAIHCPEPCPLYLGAQADTSPGQASAEASVRYCPPCGSLDAQATSLWCPNPCKPTDDDARPCVEPPAPAPTDPDGVAVDASTGVTASGSGQASSSMAGGSTAAGTTTEANATTSVSTAASATTRATASPPAPTPASASAGASTNITAGTRSASAAVEMRATLAGCSRDECARIISAQTVRSARNFVLGFFGSR